MDEEQELDTTANMSAWVEYVRMINIIFGNTNSISTKFVYFSGMEDLR